MLTVVNVPGVPPDRRWASLDHGATWKQTVCLGDLRGTCPTYTLDNVFGAGKAYGFYADGVHPFAGAGPGVPTLPNPAGARGGTGAALQLGHQPRRDALPQRGRRGQLAEAEPDGRLVSGSEQPDPVH